MPVPSPPHAAPQLAKLGGLLGLSPVAERGLGSFTPPDDDGNLSPGKARDAAAVVSAVGQVKVATSDHQYFSSDSVLLSAIWRFGHVVVRPNRIGTFTIAGGGS